MRESQFQSKLIRELRYRFPGCLILKNDPDYMQGIPDLVIFYGPRYAFLEVKANDKSAFQANQEYYLDLLDKMSYASVIYPANKEEVLDALQEALCGV